MEDLEHDAQGVQIVLVIVYEEDSVFAFTLLNGGWRRLLTGRDGYWIELRRVCEEFRRNLMPLEALEAADLSRVRFQL